MARRGTEAPARGAELTEAEQAQARLGIAIGAGSSRR